MGFGSEPPTPQTRPTSLELPRPNPVSARPLEDAQQVLSMCFRTAALTPSMLRASMTWKSTTWSVCTVR